MDLEIALRISVIRVELEKLANQLDPKAAKVIRYAVGVLGLLGSRPTP